MFRNFKIKHEIDIYIVRHGQSETNTANDQLAKAGQERIIYGRSNKTSLSPLGFLQANALEKHLNSNPDFKDVTDIVISPAVRAQQTADPFVKTRPEIIPKTVDDLQERCSGSWEGQSSKIYQRPDIKSGLKNDSWGYLPGDDLPNAEGQMGESNQMAGERMLLCLYMLVIDIQLAALKENIEKIDAGVAVAEEIIMKKKIIIFAHGLVLKFISAILMNLDLDTAHLDKDPDTGKLINPMDNASITSLTFKDGRFFVNKRNVVPPEVIEANAAYAKLT